jgi:dihydropteroate synthase
MSGIAVRRICRATEEDVNKLAEMADVDPERLKSKYFGCRNEIILAYGAGSDEINCLRRAAGATGMFCYRCSDIRGEARSLPTMLLAATPLELEKLAADIYDEQRELSESLRHCLSGNLQESWRIGGGRTLELDRPLIMGVLNLTPDSFYAHSRIKAVDDVLRRAERMAEEGADIIDIGGESTRPGAEPVPEDEEVLRVAPVVEALVAELDGLPVSVDTYKADVARAALDAGATIINDIGAGLLDRRMLETVAWSGAGYVLMHMRGKPRTMQQSTDYDDLPGEVFSFFREGLERCTLAGIDSGRVALDPGIGFGKKPAGNYELLARLEEFHSLGRPLLVGASRKSFLALAGQDHPAQRLEGSLVACTVAVLSGARILRVHDVSSSYRAARTASVFAGITGSF